MPKLSETNRLLAGEIGFDSFDRAVLSASGTRLARTEAERRRPRTRKPKAFEWHCEQEAGNREINRHTAQEAWKQALFDSMPREGKQSVARLVHQ